MDVPISSAKDNLDPPPLNLAKRIMVELHDTKNKSKGWEIRILGPVGLLVHI